MDEGLSKPGGLVPRGASDAHTGAGSVLGDFQVERLLGCGGMGDVYLARQTSLDRPVALKVLKPAFAAEPAAMARFEAEAWSAARLNHPHIVHIYTLGTEGSRRYIAMEYVAGSHLREYLDRHGPPPLALALSIFDQSVQALEAAAHAGLVHRDIKPENILLTRDLQVKVADFGLCRHPETENERARLTEPGITMGTPLYMSPEQILGRPVDVRSDLYSLGATIYHMLAGVPPFEPAPTLTLAYKHTSEPAPDLAIRRPDLPAGLAAMVMRLLEKAPERRYASASELLRALRELRQSEGLGTQSAAYATADLRAPGAARPLLSRVPGWAWVAGAALAGLTIGGWLGLATPASPTPLAPVASRPGLWMEDWQFIRDCKSAAEQYRHAQTEVDPMLRPAGWLAVIGWFPDSTYAEMAYVQLLRELVRRGDGRRLELLSDEFASQGASDPHHVWESLRRLASAGGAACRDDAAGVLAPFREWANLELIDPSHAAVALEIVARARLTPSGRGIQSGALSKLAVELTVPLQIPPNSRLALGAGTRDGR